jgi:molybdopterin molybdotransferase
MITYHEAINILTSNVSLVNTEVVDISAAIGKICAQTITASEALPAFANSAMDGYAIQTKALTDCSPAKPVHLTVTTSIAAGDAAHVLPASIMDACEIMTGAIVPNGYDAVIPIETVKIISEKEIAISQLLEPGQNIRYPGEDFQINDMILTEGEVIEPRHIMILASFGITQIIVYRKLNVVILSTGNELVSVDTKQLTMGQVRNSNGIYTAQVLEQLGVSARFLGSFADNLTPVKDKIKQILLEEPAPDLVITTGAVSAGKWDFIPTLLNELQAEVLFHKVAIRPGKPILAAKLSKNTYFLGLPGNPISAAVGLRFFAMPLLRHMQGRIIEKTVPAKLNTPIQKKHDLLTFYKAFTHINQHGECMVDILPGQESFKMKPLLTANCWAVLDEKKEYQQHVLINIYQGI